MNKYCTSCGHKHEFTFEAPSFCGGCGKPFNSGINASSETPAPVKAVPRAVSRYIDEEDDKPLPVLSRKDIIVDMDIPQRVKIESVMGTAQPNDPMNNEPIRTVGTVFDSQTLFKQYAEQFRRERSGKQEDTD